MIPADEELDLSRLAARGRFAIYHRMGRTGGACRDLVDLRDGRTTLDRGRRRVRVVGYRPEEYARARGCRLDWWYTDDGRRVQLPEWPRTIPQRRRAVRRGCRWTRPSLP